MTIFILFIARNSKELGITSFNVSNEVQPLFQHRLKTVKNFKKTTNIILPKPLRLLKLMVNLQKLFGLLQTLLVPFGENFLQMVADHKEKQKLGLHTMISLSTSALLLSIQEKHLSPV